MTCSCFYFKIIKIHLKKIILEYIKKVVNLTWNEMVWEKKSYFFSILVMIRDVIYFNYQNLNRLWMNKKLILKNRCFFHLKNSWLYSTKKKVVFSWMNRPDLLGMKFILIIMI